MEMIKAENLFELIRQESVVVWAGAGFSLYGGYPSGQKLKQFIFDALTPAEKHVIDAHLNLMEMAEEFCRLKGNSKNPLIKILNNCFVNHKPIALVNHQKLATIPHIHTIITTNYDMMFELAYGADCQVLVSSKHVPYIDKYKHEIFKVHGDIRDPDSLIITKSDYTRFFESAKDSSTYWSVVKERLITNNILFLGYGIEDQNIDMILSKIVTEVGEHRQRLFFIAPGVPLHKVQYLNAKGIEYLDATAEEFIEALTQNIKQNIFKDFDKRICSPDTFRKFLKHNNLAPDITSREDKYQMTSIKGLDGEMNALISLKFKEKNNTVVELNEFIQGKRFGEIELGSDILKSMQLNLEGLSFISGGEGQVALKMSSSPNREYRVDVVFEDGFQAVGVSVKIFASQYCVEVHIKYKGVFLQINAKTSTEPEIVADFKFKADDTIANTKDEIEGFTFLKGLSTGQKFTIHFDSGSKASWALQRQEKLATISDWNLSYFANLSIVEKYYGLRFANIQRAEVTTEMSRRINKVVSVINGGERLLDWKDKVQIEFNEVSEDTLSKLTDSNFNSFSVLNGGSENVEIHNEMIELGRQKIELIEPYIANYKTLAKGKTKKANVKSRVNKIKVTYIKNS